MQIDGIIYNMNYKKAVLVIVFSTIFFALFIGAVYLTMVYQSNETLDNILHNTPISVTPPSNSQSEQIQSVTTTSSSSHSIDTGPEVEKYTEESGEGYVGVGTEVRGSSLLFGSDEYKALRKKSIISATGLTQLSTSTYIVGIVGDHGFSSATREVLKLLKEEASAAIILGDYDYKDNPSGWADMLNEELGKTYPLISVIGNHDEKKWIEYQADIKKRLSLHSEITCSGNIGVQSVCSYKDLRVVITAPGIQSVGISSKAYADYIAHEAAHMDSKTWNICAWHKNQSRMQTGTKSDEAGWDTYISCNKLGYPVFTAHEHAYSRSFLFTDIEKQGLDRHVSINLKSNSGLTKDQSVDHLQLEPGKTFVTVSGLGGKTIRPRSRNDRWWSVVYTSSEQALPGALFCAFNYKGNADRAFCYFKNIKGEVKDMFVMDKK
jgi:hypothetical protein